MEALFIVIVGILYIFFAWLGNDEEDTQDPYI